ncbi:MAG: YggS family pyridoxal phosphate-dependent enzyme [Desulfobulbaceae bacterium]|nr:YggS family pyridoxal phosphate-dependent enzyme [Desulfobulbaceae bacterium]
MIHDNLETIRSRIRQAALSCGREPNSIRLVAVSKRMGPDAVSAAIDYGHLLFGENYLQEAQQKITKVSKQAKWHFIGALQSNKAKITAELFDMVETVDRVKTARALNNHAERINKSLDILVQINIGREVQKSGILPDKTMSFIRELTSFESLRVRGLMTIPPYSPNPEDTRKYFIKLRELGEQCLQAKLFYTDFCELSMGMSGDFETAIEEGATIIRVGTAIFGSRNIL